MEGNLTNERNLSIQQGSFSFSFKLNLDQRNCLRKPRKSNFHICSRMKCVLYWNHTFSFLFFSFFFTGSFISSCAKLADVQQDLKMENFEYMPPKTGHSFIFTSIYQIYTKHMPKYLSLRLLREREKKDDLDLFLPLFSLRSRG